MVVFNALSFVFVVPGVPGLKFASVPARPAPTGMVVCDAWS
jgi:hypothetical protein